jgi:hypothetical protein
MEQSHYYRNQWYWGGEASLRVNGDKLKLRTVPDAEWQQVEDAAKVLGRDRRGARPRRRWWTSSRSTTPSSKAGRPYR